MSLRPYQFPELLQFMQLFRAAVSYETTNTNEQRSKRLNLPTVNVLLLFLA